MTATRPRRQQWWWWVLMGVIVVTAVVVAGPGTPDEGVSQERLFSISERLKCLQCVGESVAASQSPMAVKFREEIDSQMRRGRTDDEILDFFARRYGQEVLLTPPSTGVGGLVWVVPVVALAAALCGLAVLFMRWRDERGEAHATAEDRALVDAALAQRHGEEP